MVVELLLTCSMRVGNLVDLRLGETIRRLGDGHEARWVIEIPEQKVKNSQPLRFTSWPNSARLLEWYLAEWHGHCAVPPHPGCSPTAGAGMWHRTC